MWWSCGERFDIVTAMEVVEHVTDVPAFVESCCAAVKPGGLLFMATLNRTLRSYALAIVGAEYILRLVAQGHASMGEVRDTRRGLRMRSVPAG